jgi:quercetin 2,3-dioxygenase
MQRLRRGADRAVTVHEGREARHGFSFGAHYDPENVHFGALTAHNDERIAPGAGYPTHRHDEYDLVTWVVSGALRHTDSLGNEVVLRPGEAQVLSAGTGVEHAEYAADSGPARFVQSWLVPDALAPPALHGADFRGALATGRPVMIAGSGAEPALAADPAPPPMSTAALPLRRAGAALWAARLPAGATWLLPQAHHLHVYVTRGSASTPAGELGEGDELRVTDEPAPTLTAHEVEVLVWAM